MNFYTLFKIFIAIIFAIVIAGLILGWSLGWLWIPITIGWILSVFVLLRAKKK